MISKLRSTKQLSQPVAKHFIMLFGYSISWIFAGDDFGRSFKVLFKIPFSSDVYLIKLL